MYAPHNPKASARASSVAREMEKEQAQEQEQWQGVVEATLPSTPASASWPHIASFCALPRYLPGIDICELAEGEDGRPGCVRYVASLAPGTTTGEVGLWAREKLLEIDDDARRLAYAVVGSNMGFGAYVATMSIVAVDADEEEKEKEAGCRLVWAFECEPVQGWSRDAFLGYLNGGVKAIAARIEEAHAADAANAGGGGDDVVVVAA